MHIKIHSNIAFPGRKACIMDRGALHRVAFREGQHKIIPTPFTQNNKEHKMSLS